MSDTDDTAGGASIPTDPAFDALSDLLRVLSAADLVAELALNGNPTPEERRELNDLRDQIAQKKAAIEGLLFAIVHQTQVIQPPDDDTVRDIAALSAEAESHTDQSIGAAAAIDFANRALALAATVAA